MGCSQGFLKRLDRKEDPTAGRVSLPRLFRAFAWIGLTGLGGGRIVHLYDDLVERRGWLHRDQFLPAFALSQVLPGPTLSNLAVLLGNGLRGAGGAALSFLGVLLPGVLAVLAYSFFYFAHGMTPSLTAALRGMGAAAAGFVLVITARLARGAFRGAGWRSISVAAAAFVGVALLRLNTYLVIAFLGGVSLWLHRPGTEAARPAPAESTP